ncbi:hypothetical protein F441_09376 [Phytophthora nicotianae CJ01A1]|uniref:Uncharacterized protein n=2 Tax=Phytophthora nicotianae TaxID=4792 RepID=W2J151_PHYNI|nr:hypothetical protein L915_09236 [Phytophthora nicotianae]ETL39532.1 hypothetical protein L916_09149 [Phytophthora nicotianae]ETP15978.1 hypothetical protein F441_09376 [Phytophthora nicotianae CJ01A1]
MPPSASFVWTNWRWDAHCSQLSAATASISVVYWRTLTMTRPIRTSVRSAARRRRSGPSRPRDLSRPIPTVSCNNSGYKTLQGHTTNDYIWAWTGTNCGKRGSGGQFCDGCGQSLAHTPTAQERARAAAAAAAARSNVVVECPTCRIRCLVSTTARGTLQCPNGHLFQLRMPPTTGNSQGLRQSFNGPGSMTSGPRPIMRQCPTCYTRVQMPPGSQAGQYMCPHGHTFYFSPFQ